MLAVVALTVAASGQVVTAVRQARQLDAVRVPQRKVAALCATVPVGGQWGADSGRSMSALSRILRSVNGAGYLLRGLQWLVYPERERIAYSPDFVAAWCDIGIKNPRKAIKALVAMEMIGPTGTAPSMFGKKRRSSYRRGRQ